MVRQFKIIVEKHTDGYVAYPIGLKGAVVVEGANCEEALEDVRSAIQFHIETFGPDVFKLNSRTSKHPSLRLGFLCTAKVPGRRPQWIGGIGWRLSGSSLPLAS